MKKWIIFLICLVLAGYGYARDVDLAWNYEGDSACSAFRIYRSQGSGHWPELVGSTSDCETLTFTDTDVPSGDLSWVVVAYNTNSSLESNASNEVLLAYYYALVKYDYDSSGRVIYKGENQDIAAADSDTDWVITKYYYNANGTVSEMRVRTTSWTDRASGW